jgi:hypothetical protein
MPVTSHVFTVELAQEDDSRWGARMEAPEDCVTRG